MDKRKSAQGRRTEAQTQKTDAEEIISNLVGARLVGRRYLNNLSSQTNIKTA